MKPIIPGMKFFEEKLLSLRELREKRKTLLQKRLSSKSKLPKEKKVNTIKKEKKKKETLQSIPDEIRKLMGFS